jgi:uncharacterized membrane protein
VYSVLSAVMRESPATSSNVWLAAAATVTILLVSVTLYVFSVVYEVQPLPFLDEVFHIPQAVKYCRGHFSEVSFTALVLLFWCSLVTNCLARWSKR